MLFTKEPSEVVSDLDPEIAFAFRFAKGVTPEQLERLRRKKWVGDNAHFRKLYETAPPDDEVERFHRFARLVRFSFNKLRTQPDNQQESIKPGSAPGLATQQAVEYGGRATSS